MEDKLERIKSRLRKRVALHEASENDQTYLDLIYPSVADVVALSMNVLAAIEWFSEQKNEEALDQILAAWPDELL